MKSLAISIVFVSVERKFSVTLTVVALLRGFKPSGNRSISVELIQYSYE